MDFLQLGIQVVMMLIGLATVWWRFEARRQELERQVQQNKVDLLEYKLLVNSTYQTRADAKEQVTEVLLEIKGMRLDFKLLLESFEERMRKIENTIARNLTHVHDID